MDWQPLWLTLKLATLTTAALLVIGLPLAYGLSRWQSRWKPLLQAVVSLPLVLPPTVLGFYLLVAFSPQNALGALIERLVGIRLVFSFEGLVVASIIYSLPFMVHPLQAGFQALPATLWEAAWSLGKGPLTTFRRVILPNVRPALLTGAVMSFAHTIGEFGVILMIGGSIPGETRVASIAVFDAMERLDYDGAATYSLILLLASLIILTVVYWHNRHPFRTL